MKPLTAYEVGWITGFLEGEGSFIVQVQRSRRATLVRIVAAQVQRQPLDYLQSLVGGSIHLRPTKHPWSLVHVWALTGQRAVDLMSLIYPHLSPKRQLQATKAMDKWAARLMKPQERAAINRANGKRGSDAQRTPPDMVEKIRLLIPRAPGRGRWRNGGPRYRDVAKEVGCSVPTVYRAVHGEI
jgi:hypothetical protein